MQSLLGWIGVAILGLGSVAMIVALVVRFVRDHRAGITHVPRWGAAGFGLGLASTATATLLSLGAYRAEVAARVRIEANDLAADVQHELNVPTQSARFAAAAARVDASVLEATLRASPELRSLAFVPEDPSLAPTLVRREGSLLAKDPRAVVDVVHQSAVAQHAAGDAVIAKLGEDADGGIVAWLSLRVEGPDAGAVRSGHVLAEVDVEERVVRALTLRERPLRVVVTAPPTSGIAQIYPRAKVALAEREEPTSRARVHLGDVSLQVLAWPDDDTRNAALPLSAGFVLALGLALAFLVGWVLDDAERRHRRLHLIVEVQDRQLRESERSVDALIESTADAVLVIERSEERVSEVNARAMSLLRRERNALIGTPFASLLPETDRPHAAKLLLRLSSAATPADRSLFLERGDGRRVETEVSSAAIVFRGRPALLLLARDVSRLERARRAAEAASRAKNDLLSRIGHEIRTPLDSILGATLLAQEEHPTESVRENLASIEVSAHELLIAVENALDLSRLESRDSTSADALFDPRALVSEALRQMAPRARARGALLVDVVRRDVPATLIGDASQIERLLLALLGAAISAARQGEIAVLIHRGPALADAASSLQIDVRCETEHRAYDEDDLTDATDTGSAPTRDAAGSVLGLALARESVVSAGGLFETQSDGGELSLSIAIPVRIAMDARTPAPNEALLGRSALIVHPSSLVRDALRECLLTLGVRAVATTDAEAAREAARHSRKQNAPFDVLLADVELLARAMDDVSAVQSDMAPGAPAIAVARRPTADLPGRAISSIALPCPLPLLRSALLLSQDALPRSAPLASGRARVLVVDDSEINRRLIVRALERAGLAVRAAPDGAAALAEVQRNGADLVLMDLEMPILDGLATTRRLRRLPEQRDVPVIALTARARPEDRDACFAAGLDDFLTKPVDREELLATVHRWLVEDRALLRAEKRRAAPSAVPVGS